MQKKEGKRSTIRSLIFSLVISVVIIPSIFYLFFFTAWKSGNFITNEFLNEDRTREEMSAIEEALERYYLYNNHYPLNYSSFVDSKPIWSSWKKDSWGNKYKYSFLDSANYRLLSSGKDEIFETGDDIFISSTKK
ncbi:MAG: type II secretion system protein GspG [Oceanospirillaceae bacterium]|nr:type II secretion system protein GspG [Oceanospirillaceae bacterium]